MISTKIKKKKNQPSNLKHIHVLTVRPSNLPYWYIPQVGAHPAKLQPERGSHHKEGAAISQIRCFQAFYITTSYIYTSVSIVRTLNLTETQFHKTVLSYRKKARHGDWHKDRNIDKWNKSELRKKILKIRTVRHLNKKAQCSWPLNPHHTVENLHRTLVGPSNPHPRIHSTLHLVCSIIVMHSLEEICIKVD